jgi:hypothetical protein
MVLQLVEAYRAQTSKSSQQLAHQRGRSLPGPNSSMFWFLPAGRVEVQGDAGRLHRLRRLLSVAVAAVLVAGQSFGFLLLPWARPKP